VYDLELLMAHGVKMKLALIVFLEVLLAHLEIPRMKPVVRRIWGRNKSFTVCLATWEVDKLRMKSLAFVNIPS
jgi:hypothetical protein